MYVCATHTKTPKIYKTKTSSMQNAKIAQTMPWMTYFRKSYDDFTVEYDAAVFLYSLRTPQQ